MKLNTMILTIGFPGLVGVNTAIAALTLSEIGVSGQNAAMNQTAILVVSMIIAALAPTLASVAAYIKSKSALDSAMEIRKIASDTATSVKEVHSSVNSERTAMLEEVKNLRIEILNLSKSKSMLEEHQRGMEVAQTVKNQVAEEVRKIEIVSN